MLITLESLAAAIDHALLQPAQTDKEFGAGCDLALKWAVAAVCVKSADVPRARLRVASSSVAICAVVGFPHANVALNVVSFEARHALDSGATEIDAVVPLARVLSEDWGAVQEHVAGLNETVIAGGGCLKVIFETGLIGNRAAKVRLCTICRDLGVAYVKTSTGFAIGHRSDGALESRGATLEDVQLLVSHAGPKCRVKASGGIRTLEDAISFLRAGASRLGTASTERILSEASRVLPPAS
jgi:deoxyribose-phosphate aldolase